MMRVISLVEKGWPGARQVSIQLSQQGIRVRHLVRGVLPRELLEQLTPYPGVSIHGLEPRWYRVVVWIELLVAAASRQLDAVLVDNAKAAAWVARWVPGAGARVALVEELPDGASPRIVPHAGAQRPQALAGLS